MPWSPLSAKAPWSAKIVDEVVEEVQKCSILVP